MESFLNKSELKRMGWTPALIGLLLGKADRVEHKRARGCYHYEAHLYSSDRVAAGMADPRFVEVAERRRLRDEAPARRRAELDTGYRDRDWREVLPDAARRMFGLNRWAKHKACGAVRRVEIYQIKEEFVALLYREGLCTACWQHVASPQRCHCGGEGCDRCDGTGEWRSGSVFYLFSFSVGGQKYTWHMPASSLSFPVRMTAAPSTWDGVVGVKPTGLTRGQVAMAMEVVRWVIDRAAASRPQPVDAPQFALFETL